VKIPNLGWVKMREYLRFSGKIYSATVSRTANKWFVSFNMEVSSNPPARKNQAAVGIDLGINHFATLDNGVFIDEPKPLKKRLRRLKRLSRKLFKKQKGSSNFQKQKLKISCLC